MADYYFYATVSIQIRSSNREWTPSCANERRSLQHTIFAYTGVHSWLNGAPSRLHWRQPHCFHLPVARPWLFLKYWAPVIIWMIVIFSASTDAFSSRHTSRFIGPFLRWFKPNISDEAINTVQSVVRKGAHVTEYAILSILFWRALRKPERQDERAWQWRHAAIAFLIATAYAISDEFHQSFVPSRTAQSTDVLFDSSGALLGLIVVWLFGRWRNYW